MQKIIKIFLVVILFGVLVLAQEERKVLVEIFTNSHCTVCPPAYSTLNAYDQNSPNADKINYIFYHMIYPYSDDPLYHASSTDSDERNNYYGPFSATPQAFFDGIIQPNNYSSWAPQLDAKVSEESPFSLTLSGTKTNNSIEINAEVYRSGNVSDNDLLIHFVLVENISYQGRNGISYHKNVMRKMIPSFNGESFSINLEETKHVIKTLNITESLIADSSGVVVFIQSTSSKIVYQSAYISYSELSMTTGVEPGIKAPSEFSLEQNYPNPFNPSTKITYHLPEVNFVSLKVYNLLGKEISTLVNERQSKGTYEYSFNGVDLSSGIYLYELTGVNSSGEKNVLTKKMILLK